MIAVLFVLPAFVNAQDPLGNKPRNETTRVVARDAYNINEPLYLKDGAEIDREALNEIEPDQISAIHVLKDTAAIAIYGERARNGVIIIEMKPAQIQEDSSQLSDTNTIPRLILSSADTSQHQPLYLLDGKKISETEMNAIDPKEIESVTVYKYKEETNMHGPAGKYGVVDIRMKPKTADSEKKLKKKS